MTREEAKQKTNAAATYLAALGDTDSGTQTETDLAAGLHEVAEWIEAHGVLEMEPLVECQRGDMIGGPCPPARPRNIQREREIKQARDQFVTHSPIQFIDGLNVPYHGDRGDTDPATVAPADPAPLTFSPVSWAGVGRMVSECGRYTICQTFMGDLWFCAVEGKPVGEWSPEYESQESARQWAEAHAAGNVYSVEPVEQSEAA